MKTNESASDAEIATQPTANKHSDKIRLAKTRILGSREEVVHDFFGPTFSNEGAFAATSVECLPLVEADIAALTAATHDSEKLFFCDTRTNGPAQVEQDVDNIAREVSDLEDLGVKPHW